jgi:hypothetical protein
MEVETINNKNGRRKPSYGKRFAELSVGLITNKAIDSIFNYLLYPFVIYKFGILKGGVVMTFLSLLACIGIMKFYDWSKRDWLGIEAIKSLKGYEGSRKAGKLTAWVLQRSDPVALMLLSIYFDPFITTAYMRRGKFSGMSRRDWKIFMFSLLLGNAYWTLACYMGITLVEWVWKSLV